MTLLILTDHVHCLRNGPFPAGPRLCIFWSLRFMCTEPFLNPQRPRLHTPLLFARPALRITRLLAITDGVFVLAAVASGLLSWGHFISSTIIDLIAQIYLNWTKLDNATTKFNNEMHSADNWVLNPVILHYWQICLFLILWQCLCYNLYC